MEAETRLETLKRCVEDVRLDLLLDAATIAERRRHCLELALLDRRAADFHWVRIGEIVDKVLADLLNGASEGE
jgi:hypothetical protein